MNIELKPIAAQVVVVFGASSGIGRLAALEFARRGAKVCVAARTENALKTLVEEIESTGGEAFYQVADAAEFTEVQAVAEKTFEKYGGIDTWVHAAGVFLFATFEKTSPEEFEQVIRINLLGQMHGAKAALPFLKKRGGGALIHISSIEAWRPVPFQSAYGASKHGLSGFLQALRLELEHDETPVSVTQIVPAAINTPIYEKGRNKMPFKPRPVPPIYHPQTVVDAVLYASENPSRDIASDTAAALIIATERVSPRFADWFTGKVGFFGQTSSDKRTGEHLGTLFEPVEGLGDIEGKFKGEQVGIDPYNFLILHPRLKNTLLAALGVAGGYLLYKTLRENDETEISEPKRRLDK